MASAGNEAAPDGAIPCQEEVRAAFICTQVMGPAECACFGDTTTFVDDFPRVTRESFLGTMAFATPQDPAFCDIADDRVCEYYNTNQSCCCQVETDMARKCLVEKVLSNELPMPLPAPCQSDCSKGDVKEGGGGGGSLGIIVGIVLLLLVGGGVGFFFWRRKQGKEMTLPICCPRGGDNKDNDTNKKSASDDDEEENDDSASDVDFTVKEIAIEGKASKDTSSDNSTSSSVDYIEDIEQGRDNKVNENLVPSKSSLHAAPQDPSSDREVEARDSAVSKAAELKKKRNAIETWNKEKKQGSTRSLVSYMSEEEDDLVPVRKDTSDDELKPRRSRRERRSRRGRNGDMERAHSDGDLHVPDDEEDDIFKAKSTARPDDEAMKVLMSKLEETSAGLNARLSKYQEELERVAREKESSKQRVKELSRDRQDMTERMAQLEEAQLEQATKIRAAEQERLDAEQRIAELEAKNQKLASKLKKQKSASKLDTESSDDGERKMRRSSSKNRLYEDDDGRKMQRSSSKSRLTEDEDGRKMQRSSSKSRLYDNDGRKMPRSSSKSRLTDDEDGRKMRRSSSRSRLTEDEEGRKMKRSSSRSRLEEKKPSSKVEDLATSWNHTAYANVKF